MTFCVTYEDKAAVRTSLLVADDWLGAYHQAEESRYGMELVDLLLLVP